MRRLFLFFALFAVSACSDQFFENTNKKVLDENAVKMIDDILHAASSHDTQYFLDNSHPNLQSEGFRTSIEAIWEHVPNAPEQQRVLGGASASWTSEGGYDAVTFSTQHQVTYESSRILYTLGLSGPDSENLKIVNFRINVLDQDLVEHFAFSLGQKGAAHWAVLCYTVFAPIFCIWVAVRAFRMRKQLVKPKRWIFFCLLGIISLQFNWTSGDYGFQLIHFQLLGAGFTKAGLFAPWIFSISLPLGALMFLIYEKTGRLGIKTPASGVNNSIPE